MTSLAKTGSQRRINPLIKSSKELFQHGQEHGSQNSSFDRLVAGIHVDNALELFLKFHGAQHNIRNYKNMQVPTLLTELEPHLPELTQFGGDLRIFHDIRNGAYRMGASLDKYNLNWGLELVKSFFKQIEQREKQETRTLTNGGSRHSTQTYGEAERELETAIKLFEELTPKSTREKYERVLLHVFKAVELWLDDRLRKLMMDKTSFTGISLEQEISRFSLSRKIEILKKERIIKDPVLLRELKQVTQLRNTIVHFKESLAVPLTLSEAYKYLQIAMHFIKLKKPSRYQGQAAEDQVGRILQEYNLHYRRNVRMQGYSLKSRFDFVIETKKLVIEVRHSRAPSGLSIFTESLVFRTIDLKRMDDRWKFIVVLSGQWSRRSKEILEKYCDHVVMMEDFEDFLKSIAK